MDSGFYLFFAIGTILRFYFALESATPEEKSWSDMATYLGITSDITSGVWRETHFFQSIGYPLIMTLLKKLPFDFNIALSLIQAFASSASLYLLYKVSATSFGKKIGTISLAIGALHYPWILYTAFALPESLFTFFLALCAFSTLKIIRGESLLYYSLMWGFSFSLALWLKGTHAFWGPLFLISLLIFRGKKSLIPCLIISTIVGLSIFSHGMLAWKTIGRFQPSASNSGLNFVEGKCPKKTNVDSLNYSWQSPLYHQLDLFKSKTWERPFTDSSYFWKAGLNCIQDDPIILLLSLESIPFLFMGNRLWPFSNLEYSHFTRLYELFFSVFLIFGMIVVFSVFLLKGDTEFLLLWMLPVIALFICVYVFKSEMRYRIPFDLWFIPLAVEGWGSFIRKTRGPV